MTHRLLASTALLLLALPLTACGASRDVEVTGDVSAGSTVSVSGPIAVEFFDVIDGETPERVHAITLDSPSAFEENVAFEGETALIRAINDTDGNGACTSGEPWGEVSAPIADDDTVKVSVQLKAQPCPAE